MPNRRTTPGGYRRARQLRRNTTEAEAKLWSRLRAHRLAGTGFRRQHAIGPCIVDFCEPRAKLIVEVDGGGHLEQGTLRQLVKEVKAPELDPTRRDEILDQMQRLLKNNDKTQLQSKSRSRMGFGS